MLENLTNFFSN